MRDILVVNAVSQFVQQRIHPAQRRLEIAQSAHVAFAVNVRTESVLILAFALVQIAAIQDVAHFHAQAVIGLDRQFFEILAHRTAHQNRNRPSIGARWKNGSA